MTKLTKLQLSLLADVDRRDDGGLSRPAGMRSAVAVKIAATLIEDRLVREVRTKGDMPVWREDEEGKKFSLTILKAGRAALQATSGQGETEEARDAVADAQRVPEPVAGPKLGRPGSKRALIVDLLQRPGGVTIKDLTEATGWLPHTTRAALTGLRKIGLVIDRQRGDETRGSVYRLAGKSAEAA